MTFRSRHHLNACIASKRSECAHERGGAELTANHSCTKPRGAVRLDTADERVECWLTLRDRLVVLMAAQGFCLQTARAPDAKPAPPFARGPSLQPRCLCHAALPALTLDATAVSWLPSGDIQARIDALKSTLLWSCCLDRSGRNQ